MGVYAYPTEAAKAAAARREKKLERIQLELLDALAELMNALRPLDDGGESGLDGPIARRAVVRLNAARQEAYDAGVVLKLDCEAVKGKTPRKGEPFPTLGQAI